MNPVKVRDISIGCNNPLVLIAGPCVIESRDHCLMMAESIASIAARCGMPFIFKASFDKANRSSGKSYRGPGLDEGLKILAEAAEVSGAPVLTDIHEAHQAAPVAEVADVLQIPAFLCRQTDLLLAAAATGRAINIKKGQWMAPQDMAGVMSKATDAGNDKLILTERGTSFGYNRLVSDMRSLVIMRSFAPVVFDATHSVQLPGAGEGVSGGEAHFVPYLAKAACAVGIDAIFLEVHDNPRQALSDGPNMLRLDELEHLLVILKAIDGLAEKTLPH